jgi:hypothetical protein
LILEFFAGRGEQIAYFRSGIADGNDHRNIWY